MKTSQKQISLFGQDESTFSQEGSLANHTPWQASERAKRTSATYGQKCLEQLERFNRVGLWGKTFSGLLIGMEGWSSTRCKLSWKLKGTRYSRLYFQLVASTLRTDETGLGLSHTMLPTPVAADATMGAVISPNDTYRETSGLPRKVNRNGTDGSVGLARLVQLMPTPTTRDWKGASSKEALEEAGRNETNSLPDYFAQSGKSSQLNPLFVMEMMGFPPNWTVLPFQNGDKSQSKQEATQ